MNTRIYTKLLLVGALLTAATSCQKRLDLYPYNSNPANTIFSSYETTVEAAAKVYGSFALTGNSGTAGSPDIPTDFIDEGTSDFVRLYWCAQELPTDEAVTAWTNDIGIIDFHDMNWSSSNKFINGLYYRSLYQVSVVNEFLRRANGTGFSAEQNKDIQAYREEARFLRAFQYWIMMDHFGKSPFTTEASPVGFSLPPVYNREQLFNYVETELKELENSDILPTPPNRSPYGRADKGAVWALLARMYLNAGVYLGPGKERYADAATYAQKVINAGYSLHPNYHELTMADNNLTCREEFILSVNYDGLHTKGYGGTTFLTHCANSSSGAIIRFDSIGIDKGWDGMRTTKEWVYKFGFDSKGTNNSVNSDTIPGFGGDTAANHTSDDRAQFARRGQTLDINRANSTGDNRYKTFSEGYLVLKYINKTSTDSVGNDNTKGFSDIDFPLFRLAEMHLIYAEAAARGQGDRGVAVNYINLLRNRAHTTTITDGDLTPDFVLDERGREMYWECQRRTDLVRYNYFTTATNPRAIWTLKGGVNEGRAVEDFRNLYPIAAKDLNANPNLQPQNLGY